MWRACEQGNLGEVQKRVWLGADIFEEDQDGATPLALACMCLYYKGCDHLATAKWLYAKGAAIDTVDYCGFTPLHNASHGIHKAIDMVRWLFTVGVDIHAKTDAGITPLHLACDGQFSIVKCLYEMGADIHAKDNFGLTPLHHACDGVYLTIAKWLVERGVDIRAKTDDGSSALYFVCNDIYEIDCRNNDFDKDEPEDHRDRYMSRDLVPTAHWLVLQGATNGDDGHVDPEVLRRDVCDYGAPLAELLGATIAQHQAFFIVLAGTIRTRKRARCAACRLSLLEGQELPLSLVANFLGVVRGRALRNAREALLLL